MPKNTKKPLKITLIIGLKSQIVTDNLAKFEWKLTLMIGYKKYKKDPHPPDYIQV